MNNKENERLDMASPDLVNQNIEKLAALFPNCITETAEGKAIDFDLLKQELNYAVVENNKERYRLEWPGKKEAIVTANLPTTKTLRPIKASSVNFDTTENIYIEGDNLDVLKLLQESYLGEIKMIYIDPPYNTGNDFVYVDDFTKDSKEFNIESGLIDDEGRKFSGLKNNPATAGRYHSDWLSMMYPRLKLARNLLKPDGVILISIDDNEVQNLRKICDEIFGEDNFLVNLIWEKRFTRSNNSKMFTTLTENILVYRKTPDLQEVKEPRNEKSDSIYSNPDNDPRGVWTSVSIVNPATKEQRPNLHYPIQNPTTGEEIIHPTNAWKFEKKKYFEYAADNKLHWGRDGDNKYPRLKKFLSEMDGGMVPVDLWSYKDTGTTDQGSKELENLFNAKVFDFPKPTMLIKRMLKIFCKQNDIVLDFFSGSATTADAVMQYNSESGSALKYIMAQLPETINENSEAYKQGFANIVEVGKERIRRAASKLKKENSAAFDSGFRVFRLDSSNMQDVYYRPKDYSQKSLDMFTNNVKVDRTPEDLVVQVMLDWGLPLSLKIERREINGKEVFVIAGNSLYACFSNGIDEEFAKKVAMEKPLRIVFQDAGFKNDTAKTNVKQLLKQLSPETEMKVI